MTPSSTHSSWMGFRTPRKGIFLPSLCSFPLYSPLQTGQFLSPPAGMWVLVLLAPLNAARAGRVQAGLLVAL